MGVVLAFGTADASHPRNRSAVKRLRAAGREVRICSHPLLTLSQDAGSIAHNPLRLFALGAKAIGAYALLSLRLLWNIRGTDEIHVGTMGHVDVLIAWPIRKLFSVPLTFDPLVSLYDTAVSDRRLFKPRTFAAKALWLLDWLAFHAADSILIDTRAHRDFLTEEFTLSPEKFSVIPLKAGEEFRPMEVSRPEKDRGRFVVLFHGKFIPLHGIEKILLAQSLIEKSGENRVLLRFAGEGQKFQEMRQLSDDLQLKNVEWLGWRPFGEMPRIIGTSDLCLGAFGDSDKAKRVVPHKVWEALACGKRVVSQLMPKPEQDPLLEGVRFVEPTPEAIASAILEELRSASPEGKQKIEAL